MGHLWLAANHILHSLSLDNDIQSVVLADLGLLEEFLEKANAQSMVLGDGEGVGIIGLDHHDVGADLPIHGPTRSAEFLDGFRS